LNLYLKHMIEFIETILSPDIQSKFFILKFIFIFFSLFAFGFIIFAWRQTRWVGRTFMKNWTEFSSMKTYEAVGFEKKWEKVKKRLGKNWESEAKLAIIEADNLLDSLLKRMAFKGESLGERLKQVSKEILPSLDDVWDAHKTRNDIVHDPDYRLSMKKARSVLEFYEEAFKSLEAL